MSKTIDIRAARENRIREALLAEAVEIGTAKARACGLRPNEPELLAALVAEAIEELRVKYAAGKPSPAPEVLPDNVVRGPWK